MRRIKAITLALRIEFHWWYIKRYRKKFDTLYNAGERLESKRVQKVNKQAAKHVLAVMLCEKYYREHYSKVIGGIL